MQISQLYFANRGKRSSFSRSLQNSHPLSNREHPPEQKRYLSQNKDSPEDGRNFTKQEIKNKKSSTNTLANKGEFSAAAKKTDKLKTAYSKSPNKPNKPKHPIIRSFIIKEPQEQNLGEMMLGCNFQHNNFICLLDECINRRSLNVSVKIEANTNKRPEESIKQDDPKYLSDSFNNLRVKQSLKSVSISGLSFIASPKTKLTQKYNREMIRKSIKLNKNYSMMSHQVNQQKLGSPQKQGVHPDYTNVTDYNFNQNARNNTLEDEGPLNGVNNCKKSITITSSMNHQKYETSYLWNIKQRKLREMGRDRGSFQTKSRVETNFSNSQLLGDGSKWKHKYISNKKIPPRGSGQLPQKQGKKVVYNACVSPQKIEENGKLKEGELNVFTQIPAHTPTKRKISTQGFSIKNYIEKGIQLSEKPTQMESSNLENEENDMEYFPKANSNREDLDEGTSCYLRTVNY